MALHLRLFYYHFWNLCDPWLASYNLKMPLSTRSCHWKFSFRNRSIPFQRHSDKFCPNKKTHKQTKKLQPRIEPGLENITFPPTQPRLHNSKQNKFDYPTIILYPLVIQSTTFEHLFKFSLKKFPVSGGTTRTTFGSFQLQQTLPPGSY